MAQCRLPSFSFAFNPADLIPIPELPDLSIPDLEFEVELFCPLV